MKDTRTLRLTRETLTELGDADLRHIGGGDSATTRVCEATRQAGTCEWDGPSLEPDPWQCLTLTPCH